jgi:hypothetical protein
MSLLSSSKFFGRAAKGLLGAACAVALGLAGCGGGSEEPDARIGLPDGGGLTPDGPLAPTHSGTVSITDVTAVDGAGAPLAKGGSINISFTALGAALPACTGSGTVPCQIGTNPPIGTCFTRLIPKNASSPTVDVGPITITAAIAPNGGTSDSGSIENTAATAPFPTCVIRDNQYMCISLEGTGGTFGPGPFAGAFEFTGYTQGDAGANPPVPPANAADRGRSLLANVNGTLATLPILSHSVAGTMVVFSTVNINAASAGIWRVVHGGGPVPIAASAPDPFIQFLRDSDRVTISFPGTTTGPFGGRMGANAVTVPVGDTFTLSPNTTAFMGATLSTKATIMGKTGDFTLGCQDTANGPGDCGSTTPASANAAGTLAVIEATTTNNERIVTQCSALGGGLVNILGTHWEFTRSRHATLDNIRVTVFRPGLEQRTEAAPRAPNLTNYLVGHGFVRNVVF